MTRHAAYWQPLIDSGQMVIFGPVLDETGSWGLDVVEADDEEKLRAFAASDPAVTTQTAQIEIGKPRRFRAARADRRVAEARQRAFLHRNSNLCGNRFEPNRRGGRGTSKLTHRHPHHHPSAGQKLENPDARGL